MRMLIYIVIVSLVLLAPVERLDVAKLLPVEAVAIRIEGDAVVLATDTENEGTGATPEAALADLKGSASGIIYLDTADFLLIGDGAEEAAQVLMQYLKPKVKTGRYAGGDVREEAKYLDAHWRSGKPRAK